MTTRPEDVRFRDLQVSPGRARLRDTVFFDGLVAHVGPGLRHAAMLDLGLDGPVPTQAEIAAQTGLSLNLVADAREQADRALSIWPAAHALRAGLVDGSACLAGVRAAYDMTLAGRRAQADLFRSRVEAQSATWRAVVIADAALLSRRIHLALVAGSAALFGLLLFDGGVHLLLPLGPVMVAPGLIGGSLFTRHLRKRAAVIGTEPPAWTDSTQIDLSLVPTEPLPAEYERSVGPLEQSKRYGWLARTSRAILAAVYDGGRPVDTHQALIELEAAMTRAGVPAVGRELTLGAAFADALLSDPCGTLTDSLHPPLVTGATAPIGSALGFDLVRDPDADRVTLTWHDSPGSDPSVVLGPPILTPVS